MNLKQELENNSAILVTVPRQEYNNAMIKLVEQLLSYTIRYVTLNKTKESLVASFKANKIRGNRICFMDGITSTALGKAESTKQCIFLKAPNDLKSMETVLSNNKTDVILFDSLSVLLIYEKPETVAKFVNTLIGKVITPRKIVFVALDGKKEELMAEKLNESSIKAITLK